MIANLTYWLAAERSTSIDAALYSLEDGAEVIEPSRVDDFGEPYVTLHLRHMLGQSACISGYKLRHLPTSVIAGYVLEHSDKIEAVIALRRMAARGA